MKRVTILVFICILLPTIVFTQTIDNVDYISPEIEGVIAIKKGNQWAFINNQGKLIIDFRSDIITTKTGNDSFPIFSNNRCLISKHKQGIAYFGYIDKSGKTVIETQFLNALNFDNNRALVIKLLKDELGDNQYLNKPIIKNRTVEVIIDIDGKSLHSLTKPKNVLLRKDHLKKPPQITTKIISNNLIAIKENKKWIIQKIK
jgi:hypothetical protein